MELLGRVHNNQDLESYKQDKLTLTALSNKAMYWENSEALQAQWEARNQVLKTGRNEDSRGLGSWNHTTGHRAKRVRCM